MTDQSPLIVSMVVEAFVVNDSVRLSGATFQRSPMDYSVLDQCNSAQPIFSGNDTFFMNQSNESPVTGVTGTDYYDGVYLKWRLPPTFTKGAHENGGTVFPPAPNRWLVVRTGASDPSARAATAWIIESDFVWPDDATAPANASQVGSLVAQPRPGNNGVNVPVATLIGQNFPLANGGTWTEPNTSLGLTAMGPGNPAFAFYQPQCNNVFSFIDVQGSNPAAAYSYMVLGWFSSTADDPLAAWHEGGTETFADFISGLGWSLPAGTDPTLDASWSLLYGSVDGVSWQPSATPPGGAPTTSAPISIAVGNTSIEALTTLIQTQAQNDGSSIEAELLEAFQLGLVPQFDQPNGAALVSEQLQSTFFQRFTGGYTWTIVDAPGTNSSPAVKQPAWLAALNEAQARLDEAILQRNALQRQLYVMWWKFMSYGQPFVQGDDPIIASQTLLQNQLDPQYPESLASQVVAQQSAVRDLSGLVPHGETQAELRHSIAVYAERHGLAPDLELKRLAAPAFYEANNPVVLVAGAGASGIVTPPETVLCRFSSQLVASFTYAGTSISASTPNLTIPQPDLSGVTGAPWSTDLAASLVNEFFLLDPTNATMVAAAIGSTDIDGIGNAITAAGSALTGAVQQWSGNPWHPLLFLWAVTYYPLPYETNGAANWTFLEGEYSWNGTNAVTQPLTLTSSILLTPAAALNIESRLEAFLGNSLSSLSPAELAAFQQLMTFITQNDSDAANGSSWDLLSQSLDGFNEQLCLGTPGVFLSPASTPFITTPSLVSMLEGIGSYPPSLGDLPQAGQATTSLFQPLRGGQFYFSDLMVVDEWGQSLQPITLNTTNNETIYVPAEWSTSTPAVSGSNATFIQLPPAALQPGRLTFELLPANAGDAGEILNLNPICGWIVPNLLDGSLLAYGPDGAFLGELAVGIPLNGDASICWTPAPGGLPLAALRILLPQFGAFLMSLSHQTTADFSTFFSAIDETAWITPPAGLTPNPGLAILVGRPLALVRAALGLELDGPPVADPSWQYTFAPPSPAAITTYSFPIELGNLPLIDDGLVGYFTGDDYSTFNVVQQANVTPSPFLQPIGVNGNYVPLQFDGASAIVSMLVDPRAGVHATSAILPTITATIPAAFIDQALAAMNVAFRVDGILTDQQIAASGQTTLLMPVPKVTGGNWAWSEDDGGTWQSYPIAANDTTARLSTVAPVLRRGLLTLNNPFHQD